MLPDSQTTPATLMSLASCCCLLSLASDSPRFSLRLVACCVTLGGVVLNVSLLSHEGGSCSGCLFSLPAAAKEGKRGTGGERGRREGIEALIGFTSTAAAQFPLSWTSRLPGDEEACKCVVASLYTPLHLVFVLGKKTTILGSKMILKKRKTASRHI